MADSTEVIGAIGPDLGIIIDVNDEGADAVVTEYLESQIIPLPGFIEGVSSQKSKSLILGLSASSSLTGEQLAEVLHKGIKYLFPGLETVKVTIIFSPKALKEMRPEIDSYKRINLRR